MDHPVRKTKEIIFHFQVEIKLSQIETYFEKDILIQRKHRTSHDDGDHFNALEAISNEFIFGPFNWSLSLKPQPILLPAMPEISGTSR